MHIYALVAVLSPRVQSTDARPAPLEWQVIAEAQAADATGNYRDIARRLVAAAAASDVPASSSPLAPSGGEAAAVVKRSYSTADGAHSFNYLVVPAPAPVVASGPGTLRAAVLASLTAPAAASPQAPEQPQQPPPPPPLRPTSSSLIAALKKPGGHNKTPSLSSSTSPSDYAPLSDEEPPPSMPASTGDGAVGEEEQGMEAAVRRGFWQAARQYYLEHALAPCRFLPPLDAATADTKADKRTEEKGGEPPLLPRPPETAATASPPLPSFSSLSTSGAAVTMARFSVPPSSPSWPPSPTLPVAVVATRPLSGSSTSSSTSQHEGTWAVPPPLSQPPPLSPTLAGGRSSPHHASTSAGGGGGGSSAFTFPPPTSPITGAAPATTAAITPLSPLLPPPPTAGGGGGAARRSLRMQQGQGQQQQQQPQPTTTVNSNSSSSAHAEPTSPITSSSNTTNNGPRTNIKPRAAPAGLASLDTAAMAPPPPPTEAKGAGGAVQPSNSSSGAVTGAGVRPQSASFVHTAGANNPWALSPFRSKDGLIQGLSVSRGGGGGGGSGRGLLAGVGREEEEEEWGGKDDDDLALSLSLSLSAAAATTTAVASASLADPPVAVVRVHKPPPPTTTMTTEHRSGSGEGQWPSDAAGGVGDGGHLVSTNEAVLLPMDYSGMKDPVDETHAATATVASASGEALLRAMDTQVKLALQAQVGIAATADALLSTLLLFRGPLAEIALPPPSAVALEQALKDARRETILLNGRPFHGDADGLQAAMLALVAPLVAAGDQDTAELLVQDILRASSRTASGGDAYSVAASLLVRPGNLLTPAAVESAPLSISLGPDGVVAIRAENAFALHRNMLPTGHDDEVLAGVASSSKQQKRKSRILAGFKLPSSGLHHHHHHHHHKDGGGGGGKGLEDAGGVLEPQQQEGQEEEGGAKGELTLLTVIEVRLHVLQRSCRRVMRIKCPDVERAAPQQLVLGAGAAAANGTYELKGFRGRGPWYVKPDGSMQIVRDGALAPVPPAIVSPSLSSSSEKEKEKTGGLPLSIMRGMSLLAGESSPTKASGGGGGGGDACNGGGGGGGWCIATGKGKPLYCHEEAGKGGGAALSSLPPAGWEPAHEGVKGPPPTVMPTVIAAPARRGMEGPLAVSPPGPGAGVPPPLQLQPQRSSAASATTNGRGGGGGEVVGPRLL